MSSFYGMFNRDFAMLDPNVLRKMLKDISCWHPDDTGSWSKDYVSLGHGMLWNTPQSILEKLPVRHTHLILTMDVRLDDRAELARQLGLTPFMVDSITDSKLILEAYKKWGEDCPVYLTGDFAFAIWDIKKQHFFCARDHIGIKQFYYHLSQSFFVFSNDLNALTNLSIVKSEIDDSAMADFIINCQLLSIENTFFKNVKKLPPAHSLTISAASTKKKCYWQISNTSKRISKSQDVTAYAMELRSLMELAVYDRMRSAYPVSSHLSGGLDSGAIAVIIAKKLKEQNQKLLVFNWLNAPSGDDDATYYEWANSKTIAEREDMVHQYVSLTEDDIYQHMLKRNITYGYSAEFWYEHSIRSVTAAQGIRTIMSGWGGDELASYHGQAYYTDLLLHGKLLTLTKAIDSKSRENEERYCRNVSGILYHRIAVPLLPQTIHQYLPRTHFVDHHLSPFINGTFLQTIVKQSTDSSNLSLYSNRTIQSHMLAYMRNGHIPSRIESLATSARQDKVEYSYPLLDKRIVEFVMGLPAECFVEKGVNRYLFRTAIDGLLPDTILFKAPKKEPVRVRQLISDALNASKRICHEDRVVKSRSSYIDVNKLIQKTLATKMGSSANNIRLCSNIRAALAIILSGY